VSLAGKGDGVLWQRLATAGVGIPLLLVLVYLGGWYLGAGVLLLSALGLREYFRLAAGCGLKPVAWVGHLAGAGLIAAAAAESVSFQSEGLLAEAALNDEVVMIFAAATLALLVHQVLVSAEPVTISNAGASMLGIAYVPLLFSYVLRLRSISADTIWLSHVGVTLPAGACWLFLVVATCWAQDTAAYAVGRTCGRHKLCPKISPGKTVEGGVGGLVAATVVAAALGGWFGLSLPWGALLGVTLGVAGQLGDLAKSVLKRQAGVKDSGSLLPGHGGVLDRFDSLLFAAPVACYWLRLVV
jgi:phosphatidate cytidylyltransferase